MKFQIFTAICTISLVLTACSSPTPQQTTSRTSTYPTQLNANHQRIEADCRKYFSTQPDSLKKSGLIAKCVENRKNAQSQY